MSLLSPRKLLFWLLLAFLLRLAAGWFWQARLSDRFGLPDSESYWQLGKAIAFGESYEYGKYHARVFRTPGYPLLLAPIIRFAGDGFFGILLARAEAALLGTLAVCGVWCFTRLLFDDRTAGVAAILAVFYPGAVALSILLLSEAPFCPFMLLQLALGVLAWQASLRTRSYAYSFAMGLAGGAATLMRPSWMLFTPLAAALLCISPRPLEDAEPRASFSRRLWMAAWMLLGLVAAMTPWWIRNALITGRFVPTTLQVGASLYDGLNPAADGASNMSFVDEFAQLLLQEKPNLTEEDPIVFEIELDARLRKEALAWAIANPQKALALAAKKIIRVWNIWPNERHLTAWPIRLAVACSYFPLLLFALIGLWRSFHLGWSYWLAWLPAVYLTGLHTIFVGSLRYREPAMLALLALAAAEIGKLGKIHRPAAALTSPPPKNS